MLTDRSNSMNCLSHFPRVKTALLPNFSSSSSAFTPENLAIMFTLPDDYHTTKIKCSHCLRLTSTSSLNTSNSKTPCFVFAITDFLFSKNFFVQKILPIPLLGLPSRNRQHIDNEIGRHGIEKANFLATSAYSSAVEQLFSYFLRSRVPSYMVGPRFLSDHGPSWGFKPTRKQETYRSVAAKNSLRRSSSPSRPD